MSLEKIPISKSYRIKVGLTIGDPSSIGPAITVRAVSKLAGVADFIIIGDLFVLNKIPGFSRILKNGVKIVDLKNINRRSFKFGRIKGEYGRASIEYLDQALQLLKENKIDCLVTCPISKEAINKAGFKYSGHTEYFIKKTKAKRVVMMLLNKDLRFSLITRHLPIKDISGVLSVDDIFDVTRTTYLSLKNIFKVSLPRIALCGLNPHASDNGVIGDEEEKIIKPAVKKLKEIFKGIAGPFSPDLAIYRAFKGEYDAVIAMYHDQALIPLKITGINSGVNISLGLPFVRTSPLHGTAFDIAGKHKLANPDSLISAIKLAVKCALG
jgi:4-hydroxythreonine-4-phosphate dehydrogenase